MKPAKKPLSGIKNRFPEGYKPNPSTLAVRLIQNGFLEFPHAGSLTDDEIRYLEQL